MKKISFFSLATLMVLVCIGFFSCSGDNDDKIEGGNNFESLIIGKWELSNRTSIHTHLEFKSNGTFSYTSSKEADYEQHGEFKIDGDILYQHFSRENDWEMSKILLLNSMTLTMQNFDGVNVTGKADSYSRVK